MSIFSTGVNPFRKTKVVPVFYTISDDYAKYAAVSINSLMKHADPRRYYRVIIMYDKLSLSNRWRLRNMVTHNCAIEFHKMKFNLYMQIIMRYCATKTGRGDFYSMAVYYYRAFIPRLFPQYDKAIYIDSDTILLSDIGELYDIDLGDKVISAMPDLKVAEIKIFKDYVEKALGIPYKEYVNSGVILMDLKKLRKLHYISRMTDMMKEYDDVSLVAPDQDYMNLILQGKIKFMDKNWNLPPQKDLTIDAKLIHFNLGKKPWFYDDVDCSDLFWKAARGTGFYGDLMRGKEKYSIDDMKLEEAKIAALLKKGEELSKTKKPIIEFKEK